MNYVELDGFKLKSMIEKLNIKHSWLSLSIGVSERTIQRWINRKVQRLPEDYAIKLASCFQCEPEELLLSENTFGIGSITNRNEAISLFYKNGDLYRVLHSANSDDLIRIFSAMFSEDLDFLNVVRILISMSYVSLNKYSYKEAELYAKKAAVISKKIKCYDGLMAAYSYLSFCKFDLGDLKNVKALLDKASAVSKKNIDKLEVKLIQINYHFSLLYMCVQDYKTALSYISKNKKLHAVNKSCDRYSQLINDLLLETTILAAQENYIAASERLSILTETINEANYNNYLVPVFVLKSYVYHFLNKPLDFDYEGYIANYADNYQSWDLLFPMIGKLFRSLNQPEVGIAYLKTGLDKLKTVIPLNLSILLELSESYKLLENEKQAQYYKQKAEKLRAKLCF